MAVLGSPPSKWKINADGDILPKKSTANLRIENTAPSSILRETDQALPNGLWRVALLDDELKIQKNLAAGGDFSTLAELASVSDTEIQFRRNTQVLTQDTSIELLVRSDAGVGDASQLTVSGNGPATVTVTTQGTGVDASLTVEHTGDGSALILLTSQTPEFRFRDTDDAVDLGGLWRITLDGSAIRLSANTNAGGDFSTIATPIKATAFGASAGVELRNRVDVLGFGRLSLGGSQPQLNFPTAVDVSVADDNTVFRSSADERLHIKDNSAVDQTIAYLSDVEGGGNFVLVNEYITKETPSGAVDGVNDTFMLAYTPESGTEEVYLNGLQQDAGGNDYTIVSDTITFVVAPLTGDKIRVSYIKS